MDPSLGRFTSPDTIVPTGTQGTQAWDRYAFVNNNPVRYTDPTGHDLIPWNTFTLALPDIRLGGITPIPGLTLAIHVGLTFAVDLRPTKTFVNYLQNNPDLTQLFDQTKDWLNNQNAGLLAGIAQDTGGQAEGSITVKPGVTTDTMEELAGVGGDAVGEPNLSFAGFFEQGGGLEGSLDQSGNLQSVSIIYGAGYGAHLTSTTISYQNWVAWWDLNGNDCSNVPGLDGNTECPGQ
jgi:hypothetical protein